MRYGVRHPWPAAGLAVAVVIVCVVLLWLLVPHHRAARPPGAASGTPAGVPPASPAAPSIAPSPVRPASPGKTVTGGDMVNCATSPHMCGYPDATNTGVPFTARLRSVPRQVSSGRGWKYDRRGWVEVYGNGASLSDLYIPCNLDISASNVTISNVEIAATGQNIGISLRHTRNVVIDHSDVSSPYSSGPRRLQVAIKDVYGDSTDSVIQGNNIWNTDTGIQLGEGTVRDNYVHNLVRYGGDHVNGIVSDASNAPLAITHNTVFNPVSQTDAIALLETFGQQFDVVISDNLVAGGGYTIYGGANPGKWTPTHIVITNNRFARTYHPDGGYYGPTAAVDAGVSGDVWSGNIWDNTLGPI